jgi:hypothetical protein
MSSHCTLYGLIVDKQKGRRRRARGEGGGGGEAFVMLESQQSDYIQKMKFLVCLTFFLLTFIFQL